MLIFDQLKKNDPQLRLLAMVILVCMAVLLVGLWWVQIVHARDYRESLQAQSYRSVRVPAVRGSILDRNGVALAESRPDYNISLYFEDLSPAFRKEYQHIRPVRVVTNSLAAWQKWLGFSSVKTQRVKLSKSQIEALEWRARYQVGNRVVQQVAATLQQPLALDYAKFCRHYASSRALPYAIIEALNPGQIARFEEQSGDILGADLETDVTRVYPHATLASHVIGYVRRNYDSMKGEDATYSYFLPDYRGVVGIEGYFDKELRGRAGTKSVLVNNLGYRQTENLWNTAVPGRSVVLTLDLRIQQAAERALRLHAGNDVRGAVVVMDVHNGDILALVSAPASDPNYLVQGFPSASEYARWTNSTLGLQRNRATQEQYQAGSIFKTIIALAALETGLDPQEIYRVEANPRNPHHGIVYVDQQPFRDLAPPGDYNLRRAILKSSNAYFITMGRRAGIGKIVELGRRLHLGERMNIPTMQETTGVFPTLQRVRSKWWDGDTANLCIGQGEMAVTPLQMAVMTCALANGGKVLWPRLVTDVESPDSLPTVSRQTRRSGRVRDHLGVSPRNLQLVRDAMLADTEDVEGTGRQAAVPGLHICGKTGTAERRERGMTRNTVWFISFAPAEAARYAVVVMVEDGVSGGGTCAPVAHDIYSTIQRLSSDIGTKTLARSN